MRKALLDTDIFSECLKGKNEKVRIRYAGYLVHHRKLTITSYTSCEFLTGVHKNLSSKVADAEATLANADEITPTSEDDRLAAEIKGKLLRRGRPVGDIDPVIAACAIRRKLPLATDNTRHYESVIDAGFPLVIENWREP